jgi:hypothetical protein
MLRRHIMAFGRPERVCEAPTTEAAIASPGLTSGLRPEPASPARIRWAVTRAANEIGLAGALAAGQAESMMA